MVEKKKLCIVTPSHWAAVFGGSEQQIMHLLASPIVKSKFFISYVAYSVNEEYVPDEYSIIKLKRSFSGKKAATIASSINLFCTLKSLRPDVIYQRVGCAYTGVSAFYAKKYGCKMVWHISSDANVSLLQDVNNGGISPGIEQRLEKRLLEFGVRNAARIIAQTYRQSLLLERNYGRKANIVIPNYQPTPSQIIDKSSKKVRILWVSNIKPMKQPEIFINLAKEYSKEGVEFIMIGRIGDSAWSQSILKKINELPSIQYLGERSQEEVNELLASAHILINTSSYEGFPNTFIQAWMREVPVISLHVDPDDVLETERIGYHAQTYENMLNIVAELAANSDLRHEMGVRARRYAEKNHSMANRDAIVAELMK